MAGTRRVATKAAEPADEEVEADVEGDEEDEDEDVPEEEYEVDKVLDHKKGDAAVSLSAVTTIYADCLGKIPL